MTRLIERLALGTVIACAAATHAKAGTVYWDMETAPPTSTGIAATIGDIAPGNTSTSAAALLSTTSASSGYSFVLDGIATAASGANNAGVTARSGALDTGTSSYFQFTLQPTSGDLSVTQIGFGSRSTSTGPLAWTLRSDADSFVADLVTGSFVNDLNWVYRTAVLNSPLGIADGVTRTFRLFGSGGSGTGTGNWRIDDLQVVAVPEPSGLPLGVAGLALAGLGVWRRRAARPASVA